MNINTDNLTHEQYDAVKKLLGWISNYLGHIITVQHCNELTDDSPFKQRWRRIPSTMFLEMRYICKYFETQVHVLLEHPTLHFKQYCSGKEEEH